MLANVCLHAFDTAWRAYGLERRLQARLIRYADDFVILCRQTAAQVQPLVTQQLQALGLMLNLVKTRDLDAPRQPFTFLGFTVRVARSCCTGAWFPVTQSSAAARQKLRDAVKTQAGRDRARRPSAPSSSSSVIGSASTCGASIGIGPGGIGPSQIQCSTGGSGSTGSR